MYSWLYSSNGTPRLHSDGINSLKYAYSYDSIGRLIRTDISSSSGAYVGSTEYGYDPRGIQTSIINSIGGKTYSQYYHYYQIKNANGAVVNDSLNNAMDGLPTRYIALGINTDYTYDSFNRRQETTVDLERDIVTDYNYTTYTKNNVTYYTNQLLSEKIDGTLYKYTYDKVGNITAIAKGGVTYRTYTYDALNQLLSETNHIDGTRTEYEYNHLGNIRFKKIYSTEDNKLQKQTEYKYYTDTDTGWWLDLTEIETIEYNSNGVATKTTKEKVNYDTIGNPTTYRNATMSWYGRQLTKYKLDKDTEDDTSDDVTFDFTYDADGLRGSKVKEYYVKNEDGNYVAKSEKTVYQYVGDKLYYEKRGDYQEFYYFYDSYGKLSAIYYNFKSPTTGKSSSAVYFVTTNSQGDVIGLYNNKGVKVAAYEYDAWGNILSVIDADGKPIDEWYHIANANPIRFRGYYYDDDLKLYYLQSRYYDSTVGRFISGDDQISGVGGDVLGYNLFAYCQNNPVNMSDDDGHWPSWATKLVIGTAVIAAAAILTVVTAGTGTALACFAVGALKGAAIGAAIGAASGAATGAIKHRVTTGSWEGAGQAALEGAADGYMMGAISGFISGGVSSNACFVAGTPVLSACGLVNIEDVEVGDLVWSENPETGEKGLKRVVQTFVNETNELVHVFVNGEKIVTTPEHPFYVTQKGWIGSIQLRAGDILVLQNGKYVTVEKVQHEILEEPIMVYNFEVEDFHTYYVGDSSILVHNLCYKPLNKGNYRSNALKFNNSSGAGLHAHHVFPQKFEPFFNNVGINIHSPTRTTLLEASKHLAGSNQYNAMWQNFINSNPYATHEQVVSFAAEVSKIIFG